MTISLPPKGNAAKVLESYFSPLRVQAQAIPAMTCQVAEGTFWTAANTHQEYFGGTTPTISGTITPSTSKWVIVALTKDGVLNIHDGDASASPVLPLPEDYRDELPLAAIFVTNANPLVITNEMIFDIRPLWSVPVDSISKDELATYAKISYVNNGLDTKAGVLGTNEYEFTLGNGLNIGPGFNNGAFKLNRLSGLATVEIIFNENAVTDGSPELPDPRWEFTNNGIDYETLGVASGNYYTKTAADALFAPLTHVSDLDVHMDASQNEFLDGLTLGSPNLSADDVNQLIGITGNVQTQFDMHLADVDVHMEPDQNAFLDGLLLGGSPASLQAADVNQLIGISGNVQLLLDAKLDDVAGTINNIAILDGAGELNDSGWTLDDAGSTVNDLWSASKITTFTATTIANKADKIIPATVGNIAGLDGTGNLTDTGWIIDDGGLTINDLWSASQITSELTGKINTVAGTIGNLTEIAGAGQITDSGVSIVSLTAGFVDTTTAQVVGGIKSFTDNMIIGGDLTVNGTTATISTQNLTVKDKNILINAGYVGPTSGSDRAGLTVDRNATASPPADPAAVILWDDATTRWKAGLDGAEAVVGLEGISLVQPFYEIQTSLGGSPLGGIYTLGFVLKTPIAGTAALQVFVNGIKQIDGGTKAYTVNYTGNVTVTFNAGSEPSAGADVEFYGFGYLA